jgi:hypothetical protein
MKSPAKELLNDANIKQIKATKATIKLPEIKYCEKSSKPLNLHFSPQKQELCPK